MTLNLIDFGKKLSIRVKIGFQRALRAWSRWAWPDTHFHMTHHWFTPPRTARKLNFDEEIGSAILRCMKGKNFSGICFLWNSWDKTVQIVWFSGPRENKSSTSMTSGAGQRLKWNRLHWLAVKLSVEIFISTRQVAVLRSKHWKIFFFVGHYFCIVQENR